MPTGPADGAPGRLAHLDGMRGLAILLVVGYHAFARWPEAMPYGSALADLPPFRFGWLGVNLFFLISGYVIAMTLERCASPREFALRRWSRLFPAMLVCSLAVFATAPLLPDRPAGRPDWPCLLPGLTFTEPFWWSKALGIPVAALEGAFWSLFVEVKFYLIAAGVFYGLGRRWLLPILIAAWLAAAAVHALPGSGVPGPLHLADRILSFHLSFIHFGWFAAGALWHAHHRDPRRGLLLAAIAVSAASAVSVRGLETGPAAAGLCVAAVFAAGLLVPAAQRVLATGPLVLLGFLSYPLYLIHENALVAGTAMLGRILPQPVHLLIPLVTASALAGIAYVVASRIEPPCGRLLRRLVGRQPGAAA